MNQSEKIEKLIGMLLAEMPEYKDQAVLFGPDEESRRRLLRSLMNVRPPMPLSSEFKALEDDVLCEQKRERGIVYADSLAVTRDNPRIALWKGDITRLHVDAIVNAANSALLGCFVPCHGCIDNAIHSAAGLELREACNELMTAQGYPEKTGQAKITKGYNLPAAYVIHTVGPIIYGHVTNKDREELASCYRSCLELAVKNNLESIAFCCISTGEFRFPHEEAAKIAVKTVNEFLAHNSTIKEVIFNVFKEEDEVIYRRLLKEDRA